MVDVDVDGVLLMRMWMLMCMFMCMVVYGCWL